MDFQGMAKRIASNLSYRVRADGVWGPWRPLVTDAVAPDWISVEALADYYGVEDDSPEIGTALADSDFRGDSAAGSATMSGSDGEDLMEWKTVSPAEEGRDGPSVSGSMTDQDKVDAGFDEAHFRAEKAAGEASAWHQGSGTHAENCVSVVDALLEMYDEEPARGQEFLAVALLWAEAAEAEAAYLKSTGGRWPSQRTWLKGPSGIATKAAKDASKKVGLDPADFDL